MLLNEGKKFSLNFKADSAKQLILERIRSLTIISSIAFAITGIIISSNSSFIKNVDFVFISFFAFIGVALFCLGLYIFSTRIEIAGLYEDIMKLSEEDWTQPLERIKFKLDYTLELLYIFFVITVIIFIISLF